MTIRLLTCVGVVGLSVAAVASATETPTNRWTFDQIGGATAIDDFGGATGVLAGPSAMVGVAGRVGALDVTAGGWADMGSILPLTGQDFSMSVWISTTDTSSNSTIIAGRHVTGSFNGYMMRTNLDAGGYGVATRASFYQANSPGATAVGTSSVTDGDWHHLAATYDVGGLLSLYVDGSLEAAIPATSINGNGTNFLAGGVFSSPAGQFVNAFNGLIDNLQVYDRTLSAGEVQFLNDNPQGFIPAPGAAVLLACAAVAAGRRRR